mgnify:CR=1 FL=1
MGFSPKSAAAVALSSEVAPDLTLDAVLGAAAAVAGEQQRVKETGWEPHPFPYLTAPPPVCSVCIQTKHLVCGVNMGP